MLSLKIIEIDLKFKRVLIPTVSTSVCLSKRSRNVVILKIKVPTTLLKPV